MYLMYIDYQEEALLFARIAKICRNELFKEENASFEGKFACNCQKLVTTIRLLISMILYGPDLNTAVQETQVCNTGHIYLCTMQGREDRKKILHLADTA